LTQKWGQLQYFQLYSRRNAWANLHRLGQPNTFHAPGLFQAVGLVAWLESGATEWKLSVWKNTTAGAIE
jgi:hypothetical protein